MTSVHDFILAPHWAINFHDRYPLAVKLNGTKFISATSKIHDHELSGLTQNSRGSFRMWNGIKVIAFYTKSHEWTVIMFQEQHSHYATLCKLEFG